MPTVAIVGASLAGSSAAATLREEGFVGRVVLIGAEPQLPYDRPPLSKNYLRGLTPFEKTLLRPADFYRERDIEMRLGTTVTRVDVDKRTLTFHDGERLDFDHDTLVRRIVRNHPAKVGRLGHGHLKLRRELHEIGGFARRPGLQNLAVRIVERGGDGVLAPEPGSVGIAVTLVGLFAAGHGLSPCVGPAVQASPSASSA